MTVQARCGRLAGLDPLAACWVAAAAALTLVTLAAFTRLREFEPVAVPWPVDPGFAAVADGTAPARDGGPGGEPPAAAGWQVEGDRAGVTVKGGTLRLRNDDPEGGVGVRQVWQLAPGGPRSFRLSATVASEGIQGTRRGLRVGEVTLVADGDIERPTFHALHRLAGLRGTRAAARYVERFRFPGATRRVELAIRLRHATGELRVADLRVAALGERAAFANARAALRVGWAAVLAAGLWLFWRGVDHRGSALALGLAATGGAVLLLMPEGLRDGTLLRIADLVPRGLGVGVDGLATIGHFLVFAATGFLARLSRRRDPWPAQLALLVGLAGVAEVLQFMAELRSPSLADWLVNACGAVLGWLPAAAWLRWRQAGQFATQRLSSTTVPPHAAKQRR